MGTLGPGLPTILIHLHANSTKCLNCQQRPTHMVFVQFWDVSGPLLLKYDILDHFWGSKWGLWAVAVYHFDTFTCKQYQNVLIVSRDPLIYGFVQFWDVSGPLLLKYDILDPFWGSKWGLWALAAYHFDTFTCKQYQNVLIVSRDPLIYGFVQFWDVSGPLLLKQSKWGHFRPVIFGGGQNGDSGPWLPTILIHLHANSTRMS